jgi:hypothetical protein
MYGNVLNFAYHVPQHLGSYLDPLGHLQCGPLAMRARIFLPADQKLLGTVLVDGRLSAGAAAKDDSLDFVLKHEKCIT